MASAHAPSPLLVNLAGPATHTRPRPRTRPASRPVHATFGWTVAVSGKSRLLGPRNGNQATCCRRAKGAGDGSAWREMANRPITALARRPPPTAHRPPYSDPYSDTDPPSFNSARILLLDSTPGPSDASTCKPAAEPWIHTWVVHRADARVKVTSCPYTIIVIIIASLLAYMPTPSPCRTQRIHRAHHHATLRLPSPKENRACCASF